MSIIKIRYFRSKWRNFKIRTYSQSVTAVEESEYTNTPQYPPIIDISPKAVKKRERDAVHERIQNLNTVEEKQIALNLPRYYGYKTVMFHEDRIPYNALPVVQYYTRTHFIQNNSLPDIYKESESLADEVAKEVKSLVEDVLQYEHHGIRRKFQEFTTRPVAQQIENALAKFVAEQINRILVNKLSSKTPHLINVQVDSEPRHEAFWFVGGIIPPLSVQKFRKGKRGLEDNINDPIDWNVQYLGNPLLALRSSVPLKPLIPYSEADNPEFKVEKFTYHPQTVGYYTDHRHGTNIPGFWPGDKDEYGLLSIHGRGHILDRKKSFGEVDNLEAINCQGILASFGWLHAQASYQGFTPYNDITYPLVTQTIVTNGQHWSLFAYQLNTILMHNEYAEQNPKNNICFGTEPLKLFEGFDENGKIIGLNENVLQKIIQIYLNVPEKRDHIMKPYLGEEEQYVSDIETEEKRSWLEKTYKHIVSNRPRHRLEYEIYHWEWIYKIINKTRSYEPKRRPFEFYINPYQRRLDEHTSEYIPKALRPYPRHGKKWQKTFYPHIFDDKDKKKL